MYRLPVLFMRLKKLSRLTPEGAPSSVLAVDLTTVAVNVPFVAVFFVFLAMSITPA